MYDVQYKLHIQRKTMKKNETLSAAEFRKFFREILREDDDKNAFAIDVFKNRYGRKYKNIFSFSVQKETKAKIEDVIPYYLEGDMQKAALSFAAYLQANKMPLKWDAWNTWKAHGKKKALCWVKLSLWPVTWVVSPCLTNIDEYEDTVISEGWQSFVCDNFKRCRPDCHGSCTGNLTGGKTVTILGREIHGICGEVFYVNNKKVDFINPDETAAGRIKKLLELERTARQNKNAQM